MKLIRTFALMALLCLPGSVLAQYYTLQVDTQNPTEAEDIPRQYGANTLFLKFVVTDSGSAVNFTNWTLYFKYGYSQFDTNGMVTCDTSISSNTVTVVDTNNLVAGSYYWSLFGTNTSEYAKTWATGNMNVEYDPAAGTDLTLTLTQSIDFDRYTESGLISGVTVSNSTFYGDGAGITNLTGTIADGDKGDITVSGSGATWTVDSGAVLLDEIGNPSGNKTFSMVDNQLRFNYVQPAEADGAYVIEASGAFSGDLTHIRQYTGNPGTGTDLLHLEATDADVTGLQVTVNDAARAIDVIEGDVMIQSGDLTITGNVNVATGNVTMATDGQQLVMGTGGLQVRAGSEILFLGTELDMNDGDIDQINDMQVTTLNGGIVSASVSLSGLTVISTRGATINNIAGDFDTQIKGDTDPYAVYVEASTDRIGFGTNAPASKVEVVGTVTATAFSGDGSAVTAVDAATGDSATGFFDAGTLELARGGTGQSLADPGADGIFLWDDSDTGSEINFAAIGSGLSFDGTTLSATASGNYVADSGGNATNLTLAGTTTLSGTLSATNSTLSVSNVQAQVGTFTTLTGTNLTSDGITLTKTGNADGESNPLKFNVEHEQGSPGAERTVYMQAFISDVGEPARFFYNTNGTFSSVGPRLLTTEDEGGGNGIDADTLDGEQATAFADAPQYYRLSTNRTWTASELTAAHIFVTGTSTQTLPAVASTIQPFMFKAIGAVTVTVDPNASDLITLDGTALDDGDKIVSGGTAGEMAVIAYQGDANGWDASTDGWSDGGP